MQANELYEFNIYERTNKINLQTHVADSLSGYFSQTRGV